VDELHRHEDRRGDDDEVEAALEKFAVGDLGGADLHRQCLEIEAADQRADAGHDHVLDQRRDDLAERGADDHADGEIDDVALDREVAEFFQQAHG